MAWFKAWSVGSDQSKNKNELLRLASIIDSTDDAVIGKTKERVITSWNRAATFIYGYSAKEAMGQKIDMLVPDDRLEELEDMFKKLNQGEKIKNFETVRRRKNGQLIDVALTISPMKDSTGQTIGFSTIARDITDRKQAENLIRENEEALRTIIHNALDAVVGMDDQGTIMAWNPQAEKIFGWSPEEVVGKRKMSETIIPPQYRQAHEQGLKHYLAKGEGPVLNQRLELSALHRDDHEFPVELTVSAVHIKGKKTFSAFLRDISERKAAAAEIQKYTQQLKASNKELEQFAFIASHDLQEPLRIVFSYSQLWTQKYKGKLDAASEKYITYILTNIERMQNMVSGLLSYSRIDKEAWPLQEVDTGKICDQVLDNLKLAIKEKNAVVTHDVLPKVWANELPLTQLFQNLISNAVKYCQCQPRVSVSAQHKDNEWVFTVADNGIGIEVEYYERIFKLFQRLHSKSEYPGTGIGLSICKKIVEKYGGHMWVESTLGEGSKFHFTLPDRKVV